MAVLLLLLLCKIVIYMCKISVGNAKKHENESFIFMSFHLYINSTNQFHIRVLIDLISMKFINYYYWLTFVIVDDSFPIDFTSFQFPQYPFHFFLTGKNDKLIKFMAFWILLSHSHFHLQPNLNKFNWQKMVFAEYDDSNYKSHAVYLVMHWLGLNGFILYKNV